jgi:hypothetical protein
MRCSQYSKFVGLLRCSKIYVKNVIKFFKLASVEQANLIESVVKLADLYRGCSQIRAWIL